MKRRYASVILGITIGAMVLGGCSEKKTASTADTSLAGETIYGEVSEVGDNSITIEVTEKNTGMMEAPKAPDSDGTDNADAAEEDSKETKSEDDSETSTDDSKTAKADSETSADDSKTAKDDSKTSEDEEMSDAVKALIGEEKTISVSDDTTITRQSGGGPGGMPGGEAPSGDNGEAPEKPSGENDGNNGDNNSEPPAKPSGESDGNSGDNNSEPPAKPSGESDGNSGDNSSEAPEKPSGESNGNSGDGSSEASAKPSGESDGNSGDDSSEIPEKPDEDMGNGGPGGETQEETISLDDISEGDTVSITYDEDGNVSAIVVFSSNQMQSGGVESYDAVEDITEDTEKDGDKVESTGADENAIHVYEGAEATLKNQTITRDSDDSTGGDNSSFYGVGAALLTTDGTTYISDSTITTDAAGGAGIFSYGDGITYAADTKITTKQDTSGGIHVAGGGTLYAWDLDVETSGESSAAIRSDRGSGTMVVDGGNYTSNGKGSPAIYSTADIAVNDASLTATGSEAICIEGLNSIHLFNSDLTGNMKDDEQNDCTWNVILYQSMSGDSEEGNSTFEMDGGSLTAKNGGMFYTTNTESTITLSNVDITSAEDSEFFLRCTGNNNQRGWGTTGKNGADCLFTAVDQTMEGDIIWDSISQLDFYMTDGSTLTGAVTDDETYAGEGGDGYCNLYIEKGSEWIVTGDSTLSKLSCAGTIKDADGNTVTVKGSDGTVYVQGTGKYTITVDSYDTDVDVSGASDTSDWSSYEVERPDGL